MLLREAHVLVHIFDRGTETNCLKIFDEKIASQAKFMEQIEPQARFFCLNPDVYKIFLTESWTNCISLRER